MEKDEVKSTVDQVLPIKRISQEKKLNGADVLNEHTTAVQAGMLPVHRELKKKTKGQI